MTYPYNNYILKINVPHIIFFYDFNEKNPTLSLSKIETEKDYSITLDENELTINTSPPLTVKNQGGPFSKKKKALYIYKLSEPIETDNPFKMMNDADESERAERGGKKKTRKHKKRTKSPKGRRKIERSTTFRNKR